MTTADKRDFFLDYYKHLAMAHTALNSTLAEQYWGGTDTLRMAASIFGRDIFVFEAEARPPFVKWYSAARHRDGPLSARRRANGVQTLRSGRELLRAIAGATSTGPIFLWFRQNHYQSLLPVQEAARRPAPTEPVCTTLPHRT